MYKVFLHKARVALLLKWVIGVRLSECTLSYENRVVPFHEASFSFVAIAWLAWGQAFTLQPWLDCILKYGPVVLSLPNASAL